MGDPIEDYIRANRNDHSREALTAQMVAAGHDPGAIEATWNRVNESDPNSAPRPQPGWNPQPGLIQGPIQGQIVVRSYKAKSQAEAAGVFQADAARMAASGYYPISQSWAQGSWGCGAFLIALLLCIVLVGILVFIYLLVVKPDGTLIVTYQQRVATG